MGIVGEVPSSKPREKTALDKEAEEEFEEEFEEGKVEDIDE